LPAELERLAIEFRGITCPSPGHCSSSGQRRAGGLLLALLLTWVGVAAATEPARIVSLAPSITEVLFELGLGDRVVGTCTQCNHPAGARGLPRVGTYLTPSVEAVLAAAPDLVVAVPTPANREAVRALERLGVRVLVVRDRVLADLWDGIRAIGVATGREREAGALVARIRGALDAVAACVAARPRQRVLMVVGHRPLIVVGGGTLQHELLEIAGGTNVAADIGAAFPQTSLEVVAARAPDVIIDAAMGGERGGEMTFGILRQVPAVRDGRVIAVEADDVLRTGPRVPAAARRLARLVHPEVASCL
jgi:iron complex transport system substrate-binding protein